MRNLGLSSQVLRSMGLMNEYAQHHFVLFVQDMERVPNIAGTIVWDDVPGTRNVFQIMQGPSKTTNSPLSSTCMHPPHHHLSLLLSLFLCTTGRHLKSHFSGPHLTPRTPLIWVACAHLISLELPTSPAITTPPPQGHSASA